MNKQKVEFAVTKIVQSLDRMNFSADESVCLLKCLERVLVVQAIEKDLVVVSKKKLMEVIHDRAPVESILPGS